MTVPRPYEANLVPKTTVCDFSTFAKIFWSKICFGRGETGLLWVEGVKPEAREARRGPRRAK